MSHSPALGKQSGECEFVSAHGFHTNLFKKAIHRGRDNYKPEGYWLDFIDGMSPIALRRMTHTYTLFGDGSKRSLQTIKDTILSHDSKPLFISGRDTRT